MQRLKRLLAIISTAFILIPFSCNKSDTLAIASKTDNGIAERFLMLPAQTPPHIVRIAGAMQQADSRNNFIASLALQHGFAQWDKALTTNTANNRLGRNTTTSNGDTIVYIPLVVENAQHVNAFICARLNGSISMQLHRETDFSSYDFGALQDSVPNADKLAVQFMVLDFEVFGHDRFKLLHDSLMKGPALPNGAIVAGKIVKMNRATSAAQRGFQTWEYDVCTDTRYLECTTNHSCCPDGSCSYCQESCWKTNTVCQKVSVLVFVDNGNWGNGNSGTGGGGSGGGIIQPNGMVPCNPTPLLDNGLIPCPVGNMTGWMVFVPADVSWVDYSGVTDSCLSILLHYLDLTKHKSLILNTYYDMPDSTRPIVLHQYQLKYEQDTTLVGGGGLAIPGRTFVQKLADGTNEVTVLLNPKLFRSTSKEWGMSIILHELMHGIIRVTKPYYTTNQEHHMHMFNEPKVPLRIYESLKELFPLLDDYDALALAIDGLAEAYAIPDPANPNGPTLIDPQQNAFAMAKYFQSIQQAVQTARDFRSGIKGVPFC